MKEIKIEFEYSPLLWHKVLGSTKELGITFQEGDTYAKIYETVMNQ